MKSILFLLATTANLSGTYQTLRQSSQIHSVLTGDDCSILNFWTALAIVALVILVFILTRSKHTRYQADQHRSSEQAATIERQKKIIDKQRRQLQEQYAIAEQQSVGGNKHLASVYQELKQANQDIEIFLYKAYHNFLGPIATIRGICNIAAMESKEIGSLDYFDKINAVADNMHSMLEQLLEVSVIHDRDLVIESTNLPAFFESIEQNLSESTVYSSVRIEHRFSDTDHLAIDDFLLRQAIVKIVNNTAPFRHASFTQALELTVSCEKLDDTVMITLKDYHLSIPSEVSPDIFRMFYRGTHQANDHGLGLYTARYAMRRMGGDIVLTSGNSHTTFGLKLPKQFNHQSQEALVAGAGNHA